MPGQKRTCLRPLQMAQPENPLVPALMALDCLDESEFAQAQASPTGKVKSPD